MQSSLWHVAYKDEWLSMTPVGLEGFLNHLTDHHLTWDIVLCLTQPDGALSSI